MENSLLTKLLSHGVQVIDENNGKYTFLLATSLGNFVCPPLFDRSIPVGSFIVAKILKNVVDSKRQFDTAVLVACNYSLVACNYSSEGSPSESFAKNNIFWVELTNLGLSIMPS